MSEKIKITVPERIYGILRRDAKDFRILKPSGEENLNAFINRLVMNFYEEFSAADDCLRESVLSALSDVPPKYRNELLPKIMNAVVKKDTDTEGGESVSLSFKPTKLTEAVFVYIENVLLKNEAISSFYRRMLTAYSKRLKNERERIIHKENYTILADAAARGLRTCISIDSGRVYNGASVYAIAAARDELFNYALIAFEGKNITLRLAKIKTVSLLCEEAEIPEKSKELFDRQIKSGAQYPIYESDNEPIRVKLTQKGRGLFERIYLYRPTPTSVDGDIYTFDCSANQVLYYFERFGSEALILSPKRLGIFMRNYYYYALKKYRSIYDK